MIKIRLNYILMSTFNSNYYHARLEYAGRHVNNATKYVNEYGSTEYVGQTSEKAEKLNFV